MQAPNHIDNPTYRHLWCRYLDRNKAYPLPPLTTITFSFSTTANLTSDAFWFGIRAYFDYFIPNTDAGTYSYFNGFSTGLDSYVFNMAPFFAPNMTASKLNTLMPP
jgi:hypothetical protein